jgi:hypothetical protein
MLLLPKEQTDAGRELKKIFFGKSGSIGQESTFF